VANRAKKRSSFPDNHMAEKKMPYHRLAREDLVMKDDFFDLTNLIRSIQCAEGNPDCFARAQSYCDRLDCAWRQYCLKTPQDETTAYKNEQTVAHNHESSEKHQLPR
jgi:hypothetical protein